MDIKHFAKHLFRYTDAIGLSLTLYQVELLFRHFELLTRWNRKMNLTSLRDPEEIIRRHFAESLFLVPLIPAEWQSLVDIGSGAGFPGFPVAVALPSVHVTLVESVGKKSVFLKELARDVENVTVFPGRFEGSMGRFDVGLLRAVSLQPVLNTLRNRVEAVLVLTSTRELGNLGRLPVDWDAPVFVPWDAGKVAIRGVPRGT